jgi:hypothetical protein
MKSPMFVPDSPLRYRLRGAVLCALAAWILFLHSADSWINLALTLSLVTMCIVATGDFRTARELQRRRDDA